MTVKLFNRLTIGALSTFLAVILVGCTPDGEKQDAIPAPPFAVALSAAGAPKDLTIGVIVSSTSPLGEGSDWSLSAEGAQLAAWRLNQGGASVELSIINDRGDSEEATAAVDSFASQGVAGIVVASSGSHLQAALARASQIGIPVVAPYCWQLPALSTNAYCTGPSVQADNTLLKSAISEVDASKPVIFAIGVSAPSGFDISSVINLAPASNADALLPVIKENLGISTADDEADVVSVTPPDAVVIAGSASQQAIAVAALQGLGVEIPIILTPEATSPVFATSLAENNGSLGHNFLTVGQHSDDAAALQPGEEGQAVSAFLAALRAAATDAKLTSLVGDQSFADVASAADTLSHDAVLSLVAAAAKADSVLPGAVASALAGLKVTRADGLAGPELDFATATAMGDSDVVVLRSSTQTTGLRPAESAAAPDLQWFAAPQE